MPILDFDVPTAPVNARQRGGRLPVLQTPQGRLVPSERRSLGRKNGFVRTVMRLHLRTIEMRSGGRDGLLTRRRRRPTSDARILGVML